MIMNRLTGDDNDSNEDSEVASTERWSKEVNAETILEEPIQNDQSLQPWTSVKQSFSSLAAPSDTFGQGEHGWQKGRRKELAASLPVAAGLTDLFDTVAAPPRRPTISDAPWGVYNQEQVLGANNWGGARMEITNNDIQATNSLGNHDNPLALLRNQMMGAILQSLSAQSDALVGSSKSSQQSGTNSSSLLHATYNMQHGGDHLDEDCTMFSSTFNEKHANAATSKSPSKTVKTQIPSCNLFSPQMLSSTNTEGFQIGETLEIFPMTLYRMLKEVEQNQNEKDVIMFIMPLGKSFIVKDIHRFESEIMPRYFPRMKRFASFQRQLNLYNFARVGGNGPSRGAYFHELFVSGKPELACRMRRTKIKGLFKVPVEKRRYRPQQQPPHDHTKHDQEQKY
jgi:HSF-type DNA-binding